MSDGVAKVPSKSLRLVSNADAIAGWALDGTPSARSASRAK
jgi:hypothetical protein